MMVFNTRGTCARQILLEVKDGVVTELKFVGGCNGNTRAISRLAIGRKPEELIPLLKGIICKNNTSCPDQLALALEESIASGK